MEYLACHKGRILAGKIDIALCHFKRLACAAHRCFRGKGAEGLQRVRREGGGLQRCPNRPWRNGVHADLAADEDFASERVRETIAPFVAL